MTTLTASRTRGRRATAAPRAIKAEVAASPGCGRGLFATAPIEPGELIDRACSVPLSSEQCDALEAILPLGDFYFRHPGDPEQGLILLGRVSLCNHSETPNAEIRFVDEPELGWTAELIARQPIATGAEITLRYRCPPWFAPRNEG